MKASACNVSHPIPAHIRQQISALAGEYRGQGMPHETAYLRATEDMQSELHGEREAIVKQVVESGGVDPQGKRRGAGDEDQRAAVEEARRAGSPRGAYRESGQPRGERDAGVRGGRGEGEGTDRGLRRLAPSPELEAALAKYGVPALALNELPKSAASASRFSAAISATKQGNKFGAAVFVYPEEDYAQMRMFLSDDGNTGFALKGDDIVSVFSPGGGAVNSLLQLAIQAGGRRLDCFNTVLPRIYSRHGFRIVSRQKWNDEYAPEGWDKETFALFNKGEPDVVFMAYDPDYYGAPTAADGEYASDYDAAVELQKAAVETWSPEMPLFSRQESQRHDGRRVIEGAAREKNFEKWFKGSVVVDADGTPRKVYHGAVTTFDAFDKTRGNKEAQVGAGFYFTTSQKDANENYASLKGPDISNKIDRMSERMSYDDDLELAEARELAREMIADNDGVVMPMYLRLTKPVRLGEDSTFFDYDVSRQGRERGMLAKVFQAMREIERDEALHFNPNKLAQELRTEALDNEGISADVLLHMLSNHGDEITDPETGDLAPGELFRQIMERVGYDGIIDEGVRKKFRAMGLDEGTVHYTVFHPTQIKSALGNSGAFGKKTESFLASPVAGTKVPPRSFREAMENPERFRRRLNLQPTGTNAKSDIGEMIDAFIGRTFGKIGRTDYSESASDRVARALTDELQYQIETGKDKTGLGWYSKSYPEALTKLSEVFPELKDNRGARGLITALFAATSNGEQVDTNAKNAIDLYKRYRSNFIAGTKSTMARVVPDTRRAGAMNENLEKLNALIEEHGFDGLVDHLLEPRTIQEVNQLLSALGESQISDWPAHAVVPTAAVHFGPKIGAFYANLMGEEGYLTMDLWWTRTINRIRGTMRPTMPKAKRDELVAEVGLSPTMGNEELFSYIHPQYQVISKRRFKGMTDRDKAVKALFQSYADLVDAPRNASERQFMMEVASKIQDNLAARGTRLSIADIQAGLWYYEKRLFQSMGQKNIKVLSYADSIKDLLPKLTKQAIATTHRGRERPAVGPTGERGEKAGTSAVRPKGEPTAEEEVDGELFAGPLGKMRAGIDKGLKSVGGARGVQAGDYDLVPLPPQVEEAFALIAKTFGKTVQGFSMGAQAPARINGMIVPSDTSTIYVNAHSDRPHIAIAMHEMVHAMRRDAPDLYKRLEKAIRFKLGKQEVYRKERLKEHETGERMSPDALSEEMIADVMGDHASDPQFWNELAMRLGDPSLFQKLVGWVKKVVATLVKNLRPFGMDRYVHDFEQMRDTMVDVAAQYAKRSTPEARAKQEKIAAYWKEESAKTVLGPDRITNFARWFEGSKVTEKGKPKVMYHGTPFLDPNGKALSVFQRGTAGAIYVTEEPSFAELYSKSDLGVKTSDKKKITSYTMPLYVRAVNPFEFDNDEHLGALRDELQSSNPSLPKSFLDETMRHIRTGSWHDIESEMVQDAIRTLGHDGFWMVEDGIANMGVYESAQLKSATGNNGAFSLEQQNILKSRGGNARWAHSQMQAALVAKLNSKGTATAMAQQIDALRKNGQFKEEELEWSGVIPWLREQGEKKVTKDEVLDYLRANEIEVQDVMKGLAPGRMRTAIPDNWSVRETDNGDPEFAFTVVDDDGLERGLGATEADAISDALTGLNYGVSTTGTRHSSHVLAGGTNYRELLLTLSPRQDAFEAARAEYRAAIKADADNGALDALSAKVNAASKKAATSYMSSHWDESNVLAHIRFNERTDADGKRVLFIEEIQSDWHQAGRKDGYGVSAEVLAGAEAKVAELRKAFGNGHGPATKGEDGKRDLRKAERAEQELIIAVDRLRDMRLGVPDAPFKTTWPMLAMKRMIRYAADNGFERIAWTTGQQQNERYKLSKFVTQIDVRHIGGSKSGPTKRQQVEVYHGNGASTYMVDGEGRVILGASAVGKNLSDVLGGEMSRKVLAIEGSETLAASDLEIGGSGMKGFYDQMLPADVSKLLKKYGGKVGSTTVTEKELDGHRLDPDMDPDTGEVIDRGMSIDHKVHAFDIPETLAAASLAGDLPLFSRQQIPSRAPVNAMPNELTWQPPMIGKKLGFEMPVQRLSRMFVDKFNRVKQFQEWVTKTRGVSISDSRDIYGKEMLFYGKAQRLLDDYVKTHVDPIAEAIKGAKLTMEEVDNYLWWSHAGERNATIAERNPDMQDGGSGITTADAAAAIAGLDAAKRNSLEGVAQMVYRMNQQKQQMLLDAGLITQEEFDQLAGRWARYVPLKTFNDDETGGGTGMGYDVRGKEYQMAMGRTSQPDSPLATSMIDFNRSIIRTQKTEVGKAVYELAKDPALQDVLRIATKDEYMIRVLDKDDQITQQVDPNWQHRDEVYAVKIGGTPVFIHVSDPLMLQQLKKLGESEIGPFAEGVGRLTGGLGRMFTQYNPAFAPVNLLRDSIAVAINASGIKGMSPGGIVSALPASLGAIRAHLGDRVSDRPTRLQGLSWGQAYKDFLDDGAQTGGMAMKSLAEMMHEVESKGVDLKANLTSVEKMARNARRLKSMTRPLFDALSHLNEWTENASRLSAYVRAREAGHSRHEAAKLAKEISVNFNKRGEYSRLLNSTYMFFNASVQGSRAFLKFVNNPITRKYMLAMTAAGVITELMGQLTGGDDDDNGEKNWFKVSEYKKDHNIVIPMGEGEFITIPLPYVYNLPYMMARRMTATALSPDKAGLHAVGILAGLLDGVSPLGGFEESPSVAASVGKLLTPSVAKPLIDLAVNADFQGRPIRKEANVMDKSPPPDAYNYFESATSVSKGITKFLNDVTGGNAVRPGLISVSPNSVDYVVSYFSGGVGRIIVQGEDFVQKAVTGKLDEFDPNKAPIMNRFVASESPYYTMVAYGEAAKKMDYLKDEQKNGLKPDDPAVKLLPQYTATDSRVRALQRQVKALQAKGVDTSDPKIKRLREQQDKARDAFLRKLNIRLGHYDGLRGTGSSAAADFRDAGLPATASLVADLTPTSLQ